MNSIEAECQEYGSFTVSSGTTRLQDTLPRMLEALGELFPAAHQQASYGLHPLIPSHALEDSEAEWWASDDACQAYEQLNEALNEHAPDGFCFGAHGGDGACLGFWPLGDES